MQIRTFVWQCALFFYSVCVNLCFTVLQLTHIKNDPLCIHHWPDLFLFFFARSRITQKINMCTAQCTQTYRESPLHVHTTEYPMAQPYPHTYIGALYASVCVRTSDSISTCVQRQQQNYNSFSIDRKIKIFGVLLVVQNKMLRTDSLVRMKMWKITKVFQIIIVLRIVWLHFTVGHTFTLQDIICSTWIDQISAGIWQSEW